MQTVRIVLLQNGKKTYSLKLDESIKLGTLFDGGLIKANKEPSVTRQDMNLIFQIVLKFEIK
jgi:hypothetical protein